jgi:hypothetical protein
LEKQEKQEVNAQDKKVLKQEKEETVEALKNQAVKKAQEHKRAKRDSGKWLKENKTALILAVALVIVAGYATIILSPTPDDVNVGNFHGNENGNGTGIVTQDVVPKMFLIYSKECNGCHAGNSFELLLRKNGIEFAVEEVEASTLEGQQFVKELNLKKLPILIIDATSLSDSLIIQADESLKIGAGSIGLKSLMNVLSINFPNNVLFHPPADIYTMQEVGLDGEVHVDILNDSEACLPEEGKLAKVDVFTDPYSENYLKSRETLQILQEQYKGRIDFQYHFLPLFFEFPAEIPRGNITDLSKFLVCADEQGFLAEAEDAFYARYCSISDNNLFEPFEAQNCKDSSHYGLPLVGDETHMIAGMDLNYDKQQLNDCLYDIENKFTEDEVLAKKLQVFLVPTVTVNCKYSTHAKGLAKALCELNPEIDHCKEAPDPKLSQDILCKINPELEHCN